MINFIGDTKGGRVYDKKMAFFSDFYLPIFHIIKIWVKKQGEW